MILPPPPREIGYPRSLYLIPLLVIALWPVWLFAVFTGNRWLLGLTSPLFVGYALGQAVHSVWKMRREDRTWRETIEGYRRIWMRQHGS